MHEDVCKLGNFQVSIYNTWSWFYRRPRGLGLIPYLPLWYMPMTPGIVAIGGQPPAVFDGALIGDVASKLSLWIWMMHSPYKLDNHEAPQANTSLTPSHKQTYHWHIIYHNNNIISTIWIGKYIHSLFTIWNGWYNHIIMESKPLNILQAIAINIIV